MSRLIMLPCAAFLRVYEPLSAFGPAERAHWEAYAASGDRPRRADALEAEREEALRRVIALPPIVAPAQESEDAYVRWADGITYVCPWQTRLRSWLALGRLRATSGPPLADAFAPDEADRAVSAVLEQVRLMHLGDFSDEEVDRARHYLAGSWVFDYQTVEQRAERLMELERWGLGLDEPLLWPDRIARVTTRQVRKAARVHIDPAAMVRVEYGPIRRKSRRADVECA